MSVRDELLREMTHNHLYMDDERANELLDAFAHELAGQIRQWAAVEVGAETEEIYGYAADLIDPESEDYIGAVPVRPDEEPT